jgi:hypothetical protein
VDDERVNPVAEEEPVGLTEIIEDSGALPPAEVTKSMLRVVTKLDSTLGRPERVPEEMEEQELLCYAAAINVIVNYVDANRAAKFNLNQLAEMSNKAFQENTGNGVKPWDEIAPILREKWRFFVKHLWNMLAYDAEEHGSVLDHEEQITLTFRARLKELGLIPKS